MNNTPAETRASITGRQLLDIMKKELFSTVSAYKSLLDQCDKLANSMGYNTDHVIGKVMPKTSKDRTNTKRIMEWFAKVKDECVEHLLELDAEDKRDRERERLLDSLNLTPEQMALLGLAKASPQPVHET